MTGSRWLPVCFRRQAARPAALVGRTGESLAKSTTVERAGADLAPRNLPRDPISPNIRASPRGNVRRSDSMRASLYEALGIPPTASDEEVRAALRRLIRKYYAKTRDGQGNVEEALRFINHASRILSDPDRRDPLQRRIGALRRFRAVARRASRAERVGGDRRRDRRCAAGRRLRGRTHRPCRRAGNRAMSRATSITRA